MKNTEQYLKNLLKKSINETLENKADHLIKKIKEMDETYGDGETCEQCGSGMNEGECMECGYKNMREGKHGVVGKFPKVQSFDYIEEEETDEVPSQPIACITSLKDAEDGDMAAMKHAQKECESACKGYSQKDLMNLSDEDKAMFELECQSLEGNLQENKKLVGKQRKLDMNKNNKIDAEDFKLLRKSKNKSKVKKDEMGEGNKFTKMLGVARKGDKFKINGKTYTDTSDYDVKESIEYHILDNQGDVIKLTENEVIDLIENIIQEEKIQGLKTIGKPKGLTTYEKAHKGSGKENDEYFKSFTKKMVDYLKDGSKGKFDMNPKMFPQGNGELAKMDKKAFQMTDKLEDFNYEIAGQNFPVPDAIDYNEEWMEKLFKGDSMTGNAPGGNALDSKTNDRFNKMRKKNTLKKLKDQSYKRVPQPVYNEKTGTDSGKGLNIKLETIESKESKVLNEEFDRMKELLSYNRKTQ